MVSFHAFPSNTHGKCSKNLQEETEKNCREVFVLLREFGTFPDPDSPFNQGSLKREGKLETQSEQLSSG